MRWSAPSRTSKRYLTLNFSRGLKSRRERRLASISIVSAEYGRALGCFSFVVGMCCIGICCTPVAKHFKEKEDNRARRKLQMAAVEQARQFQQSHPARSETPELPPAGGGDDVPVLVLTADDRLRLWAEAEAASPVLSRESVTVGAKVCKRAKPDTTAGVVLKLTDDMAQVDFSESKGEKVRRHTFLDIGRIS